MIGSQRSDEPRNSGRKRNNRNRDRDGKRRKKCKKQRYRDYFIEEHGCRSKKPYKMAKCVGLGMFSHKMSIFTIFAILGKNLPQKNFIIFRVTLKIKDQEFH